MLTEITDAEASLAIAEALQGSVQPAYTRGSRDVLPAACKSFPEQTIGAPEVVINVHEASASFDNDPYGSRLALFGRQTSFVEREIDKILRWQSKRLNCIDRTLQAEALGDGSRQETVTEKRHVRFLRKASDLIKNIRESKSCFLIQVILIAAYSVSAYCMGVIHEERCPVSALTPYYLQLLGGAGVLLIMFRITLILRLPYSRSAKIVQYFIVALYCLLGIVLIVEMIPFYNLYPDFENTFSSRYCQKTFYYYTFYVNISAVVFGFILLLMHISCFKKTTEISYIRMP